MFAVDSLILLAGVLLLVGIASSKFSTRLGLPVLVLFLAVGMLAGEDGPGGIQFGDFAAAHAIGTLALAVILFDGGLQTRTAALRLAWKPAALLATLGVLVTAAVTGLAAAYILDVPAPVGLLLGSIVASTDAAAVFLVLRSQGVRLRPRVASLLEIESGSNDPTAIFLTVGLLEILSGGLEPGPGVARLFALQMGAGALVGLACGWAAVRVINRINLGAAGLYPVLMGAFGLVAFGLAAAAGGSGFLSIYLAGIVLGNSRTVHQRATFRFMDGLAWMGQIAMFVVLGLLSTPSELIPVARPGLVIAAVLVLVARPLGVVPVLALAGFTLREQILVAWVGLKGAVPIILATFPLLWGLPDGRLIFDVVFFVVLVSATLQGWTLPVLATWLGLQEPASPAPAATLELTALRDVDAEVVDAIVVSGTAMEGRLVRELGLPDGVVLAMVSREGRLIPPRGGTSIRAGDHLFFITTPDARAAVDRLLAERQAMD